MDMDDVGKCYDCGALTLDYYGMTDSDHTEWHERLNAKFEALEALIKGEQK